MNRPSTDGWKPCPPGSIRRLSAELAARQLRRLWFGRLAIAAAAAVAIAAGWNVTSAFTGWTIGEPTANAPHSCAPAPSQCAPRVPTNGK